MEVPTPEYRCAVCDNVSWQKEICHDQEMGEICYCGSGQLLSVCHVEKPTEQSTTQS